MGETARRARERKKEHEADVKQMGMRSAISEHCHKFHHKPNFNSFRVIDRESNWRRRRIKEGIHISVRDTFNRDSGLKIDSCWMSILKDSDL